MKMTILFYAKRSMWSPIQSWIRFSNFRKNFSVCPMKKQIEIEGGYFFIYFIFLALKNDAMMSKLLGMKKHICLQERNSFEMFWKRLSDSSRRWLRKTFLSSLPKKRTKYLKIKQKKTFFLIYMLHWIISPTHFQQLSITLSPFHFLHSFRIHVYSLYLRDFVAKISVLFFFVFLLPFSAACSAFLIIHTCSFNHSSIMLLPYNLVFGVWNLIKSILI